MNEERFLLTRTAGERQASTRGGSGALPPGVLLKGVGRLRAVSVTMGCVMLVVWAGVNIVEGQLGSELRDPLQWVPAVVMLTASLGMFLVTRLTGIAPARVAVVGLAYQVVFSFAIPISHYWNAFYGLPADRLTGDLVGVSPVVFWMLFFTVLVPVRPRQALIALALSGSAVPLTMLALIAAGNAPALAPLDFVLIFVLPYAIAVVLSYVAARIIYGLGRDVGRALELGSYRLLERIGVGGMGEVWRARHAMLARPAAIKLVRREALGSDPGAEREILTRFEREAQVTAMLRSPHTVDLYDFGVSADGALYYVMELLDGIDLETLVRRFGPQPAERVVSILRQTCESLDEAHRRGAVHRDIKPSNIVLCEQAFRHDFVKVLDFGLVKRRTEVTSASDPAVTRRQVLPGTPAYMPPEVALGARQVDGRADLYALGCVAFWLLTGQRVFERDGLMAVIQAHAHAAPEAPSERTELPIPPDLDALVLACLAKAPDDRPPSAAALAGRLDAIPLAAPWTEERAAAWWETYRPQRPASAGVLP